MLDVISGVKSVAEACREYGVAPDALARWQAEFLEHAAGAFESAEQRRQALAELEMLVDCLKEQMGLNGQSSLSRP